MAWSLPQTVSFDGLPKAPSPVLLQSYDRSSRIRSFVAFNQSSVAIGLFVERAPSPVPDIIIPPFTLMSLPIGPCSTVVFSFFQVGAYAFTGSATLTVTDDQLPAQSSPLGGNPIGLFILDQSSLDGGNRLG